MTKEESKKIKGAAILFMLFHHLFGFESWYINGNSYISLLKLGEGIAIEKYLAVFFRICIAMYLFTTGYFFYIQLNGKSINQIIEKIFLHLKSFMVEYWKIFLIFIPIHIFLVKPDINFRMLFEMFFGYTTGYNPTWWFVRAYICVLLSFPFWLYIFQKKNNIYMDFLLLIGIGAFFAHVYSQIIALPIMGNLKNVIYAVFLNTMKENISPVIMGMLCAKYNIFQICKEKIKDWSKIKKGFFSLLCIGLIIYLRHLNSNRTDYDYIFVPVFIFSILILIKKIKLFSILGEYSTFMWLIHYFLLVLWGKFQDIIFIPKYSILVFIWFVFINLIISYLIKIFYKNITKLYKNLKRSSAC